MTNAPLPTNLWIAPLAGGALALLGLIIATLKAQPWGDEGWAGAVPTTSAWDVQDSWVTNITAVGGTITAVFSATALSSYLKSTNADGFTIVSLLFGGVTVMGPVVYGAFAKKPTGTSSSPAGSRIGAILASAVTLFAVFGLMADIGLLVSYTSVSSIDQNLVYLALSCAALVIAIYGIRSVDSMVNAPAADTAGMAATSMMTPALRTSGTL